MKEVNVEDLMIPLKQYSTISENAGLIDAINALEEAQKRVNRSMNQHRAMLVLNDLNNVVGKISQLDILKALQSDSKDVNRLKSISKYGFSRQAIRTMIVEYDFWQSLSSRLNQKTTAMKVKNFMHSPTKGEFVDLKASLSEAIHQLLEGHHHSLLVVSNKKIIGILRLADIFSEIYNTTKIYETAYS